MKKKIEWSVSDVIGCDNLNATHIQLATGAKVIATKTTQYAPEKCRQCWGKKLSSVACKMLPFCLSGPQGNVYYRVYRHATKKA